MLLRRSRPFPRLLGCLVLMPVFTLMCALPAPAQQADDRSREATREAVQASGFWTPLFGWGQDRSSSHHFVVPFYYHRTDSAKDADLTLLFPLLTACYSGEIGDVRVKETAALPLLALIGSLKWQDRKVAAYLSPYLATGSFEWKKDDFSAGASGTSLLPWLPFLDDFLSFHLYTSASAGNRFGQYTYKDAFTLPGLDAGLIRYRTAGIEKDFSLLSIFDISLYRSRLDLLGTGFSPDLQELTPSRILRHAPTFGLEGADPLETVAAGLSDRLAEARSGSPVEHVGVVDPMIVYELQGEDLSALGVEPLFYYDVDEGLSLPFLLTTFHSDGVKFGAPATRHLFPIFHGNKDGTRYDFLANLGTLYLLEDYTAVDLKLLFNVQRDASKGYAWGLLPFPFGKTPAYGIREDLRFVQLPGHVVSQWNYAEQSGFELLPPFLFSFTTSPQEEALRALFFFGYTLRGPEREDVAHSALVYNYRRHGDGRTDFGLLPLNLLFSYKEHDGGGFGHSSLWSLLHRFESEPLKKRGGLTGWNRSFSLGPFGLLFDGTWKTGISSDIRILLLFGFETDEEKFVFKFFGLPLYSSG